MADRAAGTDPEGTPLAGNPDPEPEGTPPEGPGEATPATPPVVDPDVKAAGSPEPEGRSWENFRAKYPNLPEEAVKELFAEQWWEKTNYAKEQRERADRLERENAELRANQKPSPKDEPPAPHPDVEKIAKKIKGLVGKDKGLYAEAEAASAEYTKANEEAAELRGMAKQAEKSGEEETASRLRAEARAAAATASSAKTNWRMIASRREELASQVEELLAEQQFVDNYTRTSAAQEKKDSEEEERIVQSMPAWIDQKAHEIANTMKLPDDKHTRERLHKHVRRATHYTLNSAEYREKSIYEVPLVEIIKGHINEFVEEHDLKERNKFATVSREKLKVSTPAGRTPPAPGKEPPPPPERPKGPVPVSQLARGGNQLPEAFRRARAYLKERGID
jgi:hypothetical protein